MRAEPSVDRLAERVLAEFREMPCLRLTLAQACRLFGLNETDGHLVFSALIDARQLQRGPDGLYARRDIRG